LCGPDAKPVEFSGQQFLFDWVRVVCTFFYIWYCDVWCEVDEFGVDEVGEYVLVVVVDAGFVDEYA
jgi:hypothetical protein